MKLKNTKMTATSCLRGVGLTSVTALALLVTTSCGDESGVGIGPISPETIAGPSSPSQPATGVVSDPTAEEVAASMNVAVAPASPTPVAPASPAPVAPASPAPVAPAIDPTPLAPPTQVGPDAPIPVANSQLAGVVRELVGHVGGNNAVSAARLTAIQNNLEESENEFDGDVGALALAIELIRTYEQKNGPLFTSEGVKDFPSAAGNNNLARERAMHQVYLGD